MCFFRSLSIHIYLVSDDLTWHTRYTLEPPSAEENQGCSNAA